MLDYCRHKWINCTHQINQATKGSVYQVPLPKGQEYVHYVCVNCGKIKTEIVRVDIDTK